MKEIPVKKQYQNTINTVIESVKENLNEDITLEYMSKLAYFSPFHFNRVFGEVTGIPPKEFLRALRIERSKYLLQNTSLRITDICLDVGYTSTCTFTTLFRKTVGVSPKEYRAGHYLIENIKKLDDYKNNFQGVKGEVNIKQPFEGTIYIGLFSKNLPQGEPLACTIIDGSGPYAIPFSQKGKFNLFSVAIPSDNSESILQGSSGPFTINDGRECINSNLLLRYPKITDPPILTAIPSLVLDERSNI